MHYITLLCKQCQSSSILCLSSPLHIHSQKRHLNILRVHISTRRLLQCPLPRRCSTSLAVSIKPHSHCATTYSGAPPTHISATSNTLSNRHVDTIHWWRSRGADLANFNPSHSSRHGSWYWWYCCCSTLTYFYSSIWRWWWWRWWWFRRGCASRRFFSLQRCCTTCLDRWFAWVSFWSDREQRVWLVTVGKLILLSWYGL